MRPSLVRILSPEEAAYLAGLIDGEGTIALTRRHAGENRQLVLTISSTEAALVEWTRATLGVGKITRKTTTLPHHAPGLTFCISNRQALDVLAQVAPFLRSYKRGRAELVLSRYLAVTPRNGKYSPAVRDARRKFEAEFASLSVRRSAPAAGHERGEDKSAGTLHRTPVPGSPS